MRALIVHNPKSGFGSDAIYQFQRSLVREGDECLLRLLRKGFDTAEAVRDAGEFDLVVVSGGDGTASSVLLELAGTGIPTCVFPSGTANLLSANIGNTPEPQSLARACRVGMTADLDLAAISWVGEDGERRQRGFGLMSGTGYDANLMQAASPRKQAMGEAAYYAAALSNLRPEVYEFKVTVDGQVHEEKGIMCLVANSATIQNDISIVPGCRMDDGKLDVIVVEMQSAAQLVRPFLLGLMDREGKKMGRPHIKTYSGASITVEADRPIPIEVDGESRLGLSRGFEAHVLPAAARVVVDAMSPYGRHSTDEPRFGGVEDRAFPE